MSCFRSSPLPYFLLLFVFPGIASSFIFSDQNPGIEHGKVGLEKRRFLSGESRPKSSMVLAAGETRRRDPLNAYSYYTGGWNISNPDYWGSVAFTAAPFFAVAVVWFVTFAVCLFIICICHCCCHKEPYGYSRIAYCLSLAFLLLFTVSALIGCCILYTGQVRFHNSTSSTLRYIVRQANTTVENLRIVSDYLDSAQRITVYTNLLAPQIQGEIDKVQEKIDNAASILSTEAKENSEQIQDVLNTIRMALIVIAAVMLLLAFNGFLFSVFGMRRLVYLLILVGWILVTGTFILGGVFLVLHNAVSDTCIAMDEWVKNPTAHTALDDILPCVDNATAQETLFRAKEVTYQLVNLVDRVILNVTNGNYPPEAQLLYFNQSGPLMPTVCNPYNSDLSDHICAAGEVKLKNAPEVWKNYVCEVSVSDPAVCSTVGRLTPEYYEEMSAATNVTYGLYRYAPFLVDLQDCTFVRQTFSDISKKHCPSLRQYTEWVYTGLVVVSAAVMLSLVFWVIYARERKHRVYTKRFMANSYEHQNKNF